MKKLDLSIDSAITKFFVFDYEIRIFTSVAICLEDKIDIIASKTCPFCSMKFRSGYLLTAHVANHHPDEIVRIVECAIDKIKRWKR
ncbi:MAG: hypothetical protein QXL19_07710 [Ignisphaera sp.]